MEQRKSMFNERYLPRPNTFNPVFKRKYFDFELRKWWAKGYLRATRIIQYFFYSFVLGITVKEFFLDRFVYSL